MLVCCPLPVTKGVEANDQNLMMSLSWLTWDGKTFIIYYKFESRLEWNSQYYYKIEKTSYSSCKHLSEYENVKERYKFNNSFQRDISFAMREWDIYLSDMHVCMTWLVSA